MKIEREKLLVKLERLRPAIPNSSTLVAFLHVWFDGNFARAYDGGLGIQVPLETQFKLGLPGKALLGILQSTSVSELDLKEAENSLTVKFGRSKMELVSLGLDGMAWPFPANLSAKAANFELTEEFLDGLRRVLIIRPPQKSATRVEHQGVVLYAEGDKALMVTTDSHSLACAVSAVPLPKQAINLVLPRPFVEQIVAQCAPGDKLYTLKDCLIALGDNTRLFSNILDNEGVTNLPDLLNRYIKGNEVKVPVPLGLAEALDRAALLAKSDKEPNVELSVAGGVLSLSARFSLGTLDEQFDLEGKDLPEAAVILGLPELQTALREAEQFVLVKRGALCVFGSGEFKCLVAGKAKR